MMTEQDYITLKEKYQVYHAAKQIVCKKHPNCVNPEDAKLLPEPCTNEEISAMEVYEFCTNPPERYFLYVDVKNQLAITWTGDKLGNCVLGYKYRNNMGDTRQSISIKAINGRSYAGTYFTSAGDYARVKVCK
jgi:hypothetical protein